MPAVLNLPFILALASRAKPLPAATRTLFRKVETPHDLAAPVPFAAVFRAARKASGVRPDGRGGFEYVRFTSCREVRAMLHGLVETGQLEAASGLLSSYLATPRRPQAAMEGEVRLMQTEDERLASIVLNGCAEQGRMDLSSGVLAVMRDRAVPITSLTFCILFKGHGRSANLPRVRKLHAAMLKHAVAFDLPTCNALLDAFARNGDLVAAEAVLAEMPALGVTASSRSYNILLHGYVRRGQMRSAFRVAARLREALGAQGANAVTYATLIDGCVRQNDLRMARLLMQRLENGEADGVQPDVYCYTALVRGLLAPPQPLLHSGTAKTAPAKKRIKVRVAPKFAHMYACRVQESLQLLERMLSRGVRPSAVCVGTIVAGCLEHADNVTAAHEAAAVLHAYGDPSLSLAADAALIAGYCRQPITDRARIRAALALFARHVGRDASPGRQATRPLRLDVRTCNALLAALATSGELPSAERVLQVMDSGLAHAPNSHTLCIMMRGFGADNKFDAAQRVWERLVAAGWVDTVSLNAWLATCMTCRQPRLAMQAFQMAKSSLPIVRLDRVSFGTLINGLCAPSSNSAAARRAIQLWAEMRTRGLLADRAIVSSLFAACHRHLDVEVALRLRAELLAIGWPERRLRDFSEPLLSRLPPLMDVLAEPNRWAALGVFPAPDISSEQSQLLLHLPASLTTKLPAANLTGGVGDAAKLHPTACGEEHCGALARILYNLRPAEHVPESGASSRPASASQEIFERKGWNEMDGSGWTPWRLW